jgi:macrodomain Ter protein organizer (MatP/YcbG family)
MKKKVGRPRLSDSLKVVYQRIAIKHETYLRLKELSREWNMTIDETIVYIISRLEK